jgi:hypothetical protein
MRKQKKRLGQSGALACKNDIALALPASAMSFSDREQRLSDQADSPIG